MFPIVAVGAKLPGGQISPFGGQATNLWVLQWQMVPSHTAPHLEKTTLEDLEEV